MRDKSKFLPLNPQLSTPHPSLNPFPQVIQIPRFDLLPGPRGFAQEGQAGFDARIVGEAADADPRTQHFPAVTFHQGGQDFLQAQAVERIVRVFTHERDGGNGGAG